MFIKKIIKNLLQPYKIPFKIIKKIYFYYNLKSYKQSIFENEQNKIFEELELNRRQGFDKLKLIKQELNLRINNEMSSEHEILFSSISLNKNIEINNILEIGTYDGVNSLLLSKLFPNSKIDTIDLDYQEDDFKNYYNRKNSFKDFVNKRDIAIKNSNNINFFQMNSLNLINHKKNYDMIWIDGAHGYPVVCIDIINSLNLIRDHGLILCDDVYLSKKYSNTNEMYKSIATFETLDELQKQDLINFRLIYKRLKPENNCIVNERKFIAIINKI